MKGLPICFSEVQVKNDVTDNNNKYFVTAFEGKCRDIIELREHLKLCFLIILLIIKMIIMILIIIMMMIIILIMIMILII